MVVNLYPTASKDGRRKKRLAILKWTLLGALVLVIGVVAAIVLYEVKTSRFQAQELSAYAKSLTYELKEGPSDAIEFPKGGPFDTRLGYAQMPNLLTRANKRGLEVKQQARFSPELLTYTSEGFYVPYAEKTQVGLHIMDSKGQPIYQFTYPQRIYPDFASIPPLVVQSLLFIENRTLLDTTQLFMNPAVDWVRFTKASIHEAAKMVGLNYKTIGGSTLATQIEKYRHSPEGITASPIQKLQQMASASVRVYQQGAKTLPARKNLVLTYVNTVPLSGAPGYGEVHGLGDGLWVWFNADLNNVNQLLTTSSTNTDTLLAQGQALRQVLSLMIAQRRPSFYLSAQGRNELNGLTGSYLRLLANNGYISPELRDAGLAQEVNFRDFKNNAPDFPNKTDKGSLMARTHLSGMLGKTLYDLDRLDLSATTTLQNDLQKKIGAYLDSLNNGAFAKEAGMFGDRLLSSGGTEQVHYSFTLFKRSPYGNLVRVQTDNTDQPFDLNEGSKLELGSTAKLRVLATYLEVIAEVHGKYANQPKEAIQKALKEPQDNLSLWVLQYLAYSKDSSLKATLEASLERSYSASPYESFFTGGGMHTFHNYRNEDNGRRPTVREAFLKSINLPFIRMMRDIVKYTTYQQVENVPALMGNDHDPRRRAYLTEFADREGKKYMRRFWNKYNGKNAEERLTLLLDGLRQNPVRLAVAHRYLYPNTDSVQFEKMLRSRVDDRKLTHDRVMELYHRYGPEAYSLPDQGYVAKVHPLELWMLGYKLQHPDATWANVVEASQAQRQEVYTWLFRTKYKSARDSRIRTMMELDAFKDIQQRWARLGYPFREMVPSLASALGSSGDRPEALAELMGIILNKGLRQPTLRIESLHFAADTPYETLLRQQAHAGKQVMAPEVAEVLRGALLDVVDEGTARRLVGGFKKPNGEPMQMGGKTGTGDNRYVTLSVRGHRVASRAVNRTATFVFFLGDSHFGALTAFVPGRKAESFHFTSSLPVQVLKGMAPILEPYLAADAANQDLNLKNENLLATQDTLGNSFIKTSYKNSPAPVASQKQ
ncbi:transglycosylase domain-containing protein [Pontibacter sp. CAU 1760]